MLASFHGLSLLILLVCFCQTVPAKPMLQKTTETDLPQSRQRRATRLAEFELETRRQEKIAKLLRRLYIEEKMRRLTAKRSSLPVEPMHIDDYLAYIDPEYFSKMKRDVSQQYEDANEKEEISQEYGGNFDLVGALQNLLDRKDGDLQSNGFK